MVSSPPKPASVRSSHSARRHDHESSETTPLLGSSDTAVAADGDITTRTRNSSSAASFLLRSIQDQQPSTKKSNARWPSLVALSLLCLAAAVIMVVAFVLPQVVQEYAMEAMVVEPTSLSIDSLTSTGVIANVKGTFTMDAQRVRKKAVRDIGRFGTWIAREVESKPSRVEVMLPDYGNIVVGTADIPAVKVNVQAGHTTPIEFLTQVEPGSPEVLRRVADDWVQGRLHDLRVNGKADVSLKSGLLSLGTKSVEHLLILQGGDLPTMPAYNISKLNFREITLPEGPGGIAAEVALDVTNEYPVDFEVPPLGFAILVPDCQSSDPLIMLADATTQALHIEPKSDLHVNVTGFVRRLPETVIKACPGSGESPLDVLLGDYIHGQEATIYVRGSDSPSLDTPAWMTDLISGITVPVQFPGREFGHLIKNFSLEDVHFSLPDLTAEPDTPEAQPKISANVEALIALPKEMNFNIDVARVRAKADIFYKHKKLGYLDLQQWQKASSKATDKLGADDPELQVASRIERAPLTVTDQDVFTEVIQALLFGRETLRMKVKADVDVELKTALGQFVVRQIPAEGEVPVQPIGRQQNDSSNSTAPSLPSLHPHITELLITDTTSTSLTLAASLNVVNPTNYSATVPYIDIKILVNGTEMGHASAHNVSLIPGPNTNINVTALWQPSAAEGEQGRVVGRELLSQYISGFNTTLTLRPHNLSIPALPSLSAALSTFSFELPTPRLGGDNDKKPRHPSPPDDEDDDEAPRFISDATMHLFTSTAQFTLHSPLRHSSLLIDHLNATAFYRPDPSAEANEVGRILYDPLPPMIVPPGESRSPRLPVEWDLGGVGYEAVKRALGGTLKLEARAVVGVGIGQWKESVWFVGKGVGVSVRL